MRSTVGPLPPAVYWRRRAVVLGAVLLALILLFVSCGGKDNNKPQGTGAATKPSSAAPTASSDALPDEQPSYSDDAPGGPALPAPEEVESGGPAAGGASNPAGDQPNPAGDAGAASTGTNANVTAPVDGTCTDAEISVTPVPAATTVKRGSPLNIRLKIKNISTRACTRDLGAGAQELYINLAARKYWSSDTCSADRSSNPQGLAPGAELEYTVTWNGLQDSKCEGALSAGPAPPPGTYEIRGRLGTKISQPVALAIVA